MLTEIRSAKYCIFAANTAIIRSMHIGLTTLARHTATKAIQKTNRLMIGTNHRHMWRPQKAQDESHAEGTNLFADSTIWKFQLLYLIINNGLWNERTWVETKT